MPTPDQTETTKAEAYPNYPENKPRLKAYAWQWQPLLQDKEGNPCPWSRNKQKQLRKYKKELAKKQRAGKLPTSAPFTLSPNENQ